MESTAVPEQPRGLVARAEQDPSRQQRELPVQRDDGADVVGIAIAEAVEHLIVDRVELFSDRLDLLVAEVRKRAFDC